MIPRWKSVAAGIAITLAAASGCASHSENDSVTLTFSDGFSPTHPIGTGGAQPFRTYLEEHGPAVGLDVEYFSAGQLGKQKDALHLLRSQAVDIAPVIPAYLSNQIPLAGVGELPGLVEDSCAGVQALMSMSGPGETLYEQEFEEQRVMPLWGVMISGYDIFTSSARIATPEDLKGELIRSPGGVGDRLIRQLGAAGVPIAAPDLYEAVARSTVSGAVLPQLSVTAYSLQEVLQHATSGANLSTTTILYSVGLDLWESLTDAQRTVLRDASTLAQAGACESLKQSTGKAQEQIREAGVELFEIEGENKQMWADALAPVRSDWVADLQSVGIPAGAVLDEFEARLAKENQ